MTHHFLEVPPKCQLAPLSCSNDCRPSALVCTLRGMRIQSMGEVMVVWIGVLGFRP